VIARGVGMGLAALVGFAGAIAGTALAREFESVGPTWPIIEPDLLATIQGRLQRAKQTGELDKMNREFAARSEARVMRPGAVQGITPALEARTWDYDPSITIQHEVRDTKGNVVVPAGKRVNPLDIVTMPQSLVFIDGDRPAEVAWAMRQGDDSKATVVLVKGAPFELMKARQRRFYFDQAGTLTHKFGINHTPALVRQKARLLEVSEIAIDAEAGQ